MSQIAIIGAGVGGMAAAWDFVRAGHTVTIFEGSDTVGGLASGFRKPGWDWSVEKFYHHWFQTDKDMLGLIKDLGWSDKVIFPLPKTVVFYNGNFYPLDSPLAALTFPGFKFFDMVRFGFVTVYLKFLAKWQPLERHTADSWMRRAYGERVYAMQFDPLLQGKFGPHYKDVNMAWFWARLKARTTRLGTFQGGFQAFCDSLADELRRRGVIIHLGTNVEKIEAGSPSGIKITAAGKVHQFDQVLATTSPGLLARMAPSLPQNYLQGLLSLKQMGAVVLVFSLKNQLSRQGYYWYNIPKSAGFPFLALVEHTNFVPAEHFGGEHIVYVGDYLDPSHEHFTLSKEELVKRFLPSFTRINPDFKPDWINDTWMFRTSYAQPVPLVDHSKNIPAIKTPLPGLYFASMSQVYPWDRGTNFAVQIGRKAARMMMSQ